MGDLSMSITTMGYMFSKTITKPAQAINWSIGNMHDELLKMNYISYYDTLPLNAKQHIQQHDYKIVSQYLLRKEKFIVEIGNDMDD